MQLVLADDYHRNHLAPFTFMRPVADLRCGILTIREKWERILESDPESTRYITTEYLRKQYAVPSAGEALIVNGALLPDQTVVHAIRELQSGSMLIHDERILAVKTTGGEVHELLHTDNLKGYRQVGFQGSPVLLNRVWDIFRLNDWALRSDFSILTSDRESQPISSSNRIQHPENIFVELGARVECAMINATDGPVYIGKNSEVMEGSMIRGSFALCQDAVLKMGTKVYGATTIGPGCKVGGEVNNSVLLGNSNKAHDGFLGNSVIGEWCNLGADTNNSNLKNNYSEVRVWDYPSNDYVPTGLQFCGLFMGDHSKCSINTMFNTGTVVGVFANIFGSGFPAKYLPSFSWGSDGNGEVFLVTKAIELAEKVMSRRGQTLTDAQKEIISHLYLMQLHPKAED